MKVFNLIKSLAKNAGIENQKELADFLEANKESLDGLDLPDIAGNLLQENLMSEDVAKTKLSLKNYFAGMLYSGIEQGAKEEAKASGVTEDEIIEIHNSTKNSGERIKLYIQSLNKKLQNAGKNSKTSEEITKQIQDAQNKYIEIEKLKNEEITTLKTKYESEFENMAWNSEIGKVKWNPAIPESVRSMALRNAIQKEAEKENGKLIFDQEKRTWKIVNAADQTLPVSKAGKILDYESLFPLALQSEKLLDETPPGGAGGGNPGTNRIPFQGLPNPGGTNEVIPEYVLKSLGSANVAFDFSKT
jgi:lipoprotein-anchoring transpeptidase ErfK/SrfK